jgi:hypothetical protein
VLVALLILPSHLVWKPYFVLFLPIGVLLAGWPRWSPRRALGLAVAFAAMNLSGFDVLGGDWGARAESASVMLWAALTYLALGARDEREAQAAQSLQLSSSSRSMPGSTRSSR